MADQSSNNPMTTSNMDDSNDQLDVSQLVTTLQYANQNMSQLIQTLRTQFPSQGAISSYLSIVNSSAGGTVVKQGSGYLMYASVTTASSGSGFIYDSNSAANVGSSNIMAVVPSSGTAVYGYPFTNGLTVQASSVASQRVSIYYI